MSSVSADRGAEQYCRSEGKAKPLGYLISRPIRLGGNAQYAASEGQADGYYR